MTQGEVSVKIEEGGEGEAVSNGDDSSPTEETNAYDDGNLMASPMPPTPFIWMCAVTVARK